MHRVLRNAGTMVVRCARTSLEMMVIQRKKEVMFAISSSDKFGFGYAVVRPRDRPHFARQQQTEYR